MEPPRVVPAHELPEVIAKIARINAIEHPTIKDIGRMPTCEVVKLAYERLLQKAEARRRERGRSTAVEENIDWK